MPCAGNVPLIVATQEYNQSSGGTLASQTIFTPSADGTFRVSLYAPKQTGVGSGAQVTLDWTDAEGSESGGSVNLNSSATWFSWVFTASSGDPIEIAVPSVANNTPYILYFVVEQLA